MQIPKYQIVYNVESVGKVKIGEDRTVMDLKKLLSPQLGIPAESLILHSNGRILLDYDELVSNYCPSHTIYFEGPEKRTHVFKVRVVTDMKTIEVPAPRLSLLKDLKPIIANSQGFSAEDIMFIDNKLELDENSMAFVDEGFELFLVLASRFKSIAVRHLGQTWDVPVTARSRFQDVKKWIEKETGIGTKTQCLFIPPAAATGPKLPCLSYATIAGSAFDNPLGKPAQLEVVPEPGMMFFVKTLTGKTITISPGAETSFGEVKELLQEKEGVPPDQIRLIVGGVQVDDLGNFVDYRVAKESTLCLGWIKPPA